MRDPGPPEHRPAAPDQTLLQWLSTTSEDWMVSQPTMWLPVVPPDPATPPGPRTDRPAGSGPSAPSIPRQRSRASTRRPGAGARRAGSSRLTAAQVIDAHDPAGPGPAPGVRGGVGAAARTGRVLLDPDLRRRQILIAALLVAVVLLGAGAVLALGLT